MAMGNVSIMNPQVQQPMQRPMGIGGASPQGVPQAVRPTGMGASAPQGRQFPAEAEPIFRIQAKIIQSMFRGRAPMSEEMAYRIARASAPLTWDETQARLLQQAEQAGQIDLAKQIRKMQVDLKTERGKADIDIEKRGKLIAPRAGDVSVLRGETLAKQLPQRTPVLHPADVAYKEALTAESAARKKGLEGRGAKPDLLKLNRQLNAELANLAEDLKGVDAERATFGTMGMPTEDRVGWEKRRKIVKDGIKAHRRAFWQRQGMSMAQIPPPTDEEILAISAELTAALGRQATRADIKKELSDLGYPVK